MFACGVTATKCFTVLPPTQVNQMAMVTTQEEVVAMEGTCMYHAHKFYKATRGNADQVRPG